MSHSSSAQEIEMTMSKDEVDVIFLRIFETLANAALEGASACTGAVFELSSNYVDKPAFDSLRKFYDLYFSNADIDKKKNEVNSSVDAMISTLQGKLEAGENLDEAAIDEDEEARQQRLSLSGVQKQLEGLIVLDSGIKEQILPALSSMQFEDSIRQRLSHVVQAWWKIGEVLHEEVTPSELEQVARDLAKVLSSVDETRSFYELVLNEQPPEGQDQRSVFIEF